MMSAARSIPATVAVVCLTACAAPPPAASAEASRQLPAPQVLPTRSLTVATQRGPVRLKVEVADDFQERATGMMYRRAAARRTGMLFVFEQAEARSFWMKNTYIPLDIIFIRADGTIANIAARTTPLSEASVPSRGPAQYVLELGGGEAEALGIRAGDRVEVGG